MARDATPRPTAPDYATLRKAARATGCPERKLREAVKTGAVPVYTIPGSWALLRLDDVRQWLASHRVEPTARARARVAERLAHEAQREARRAG